jgi:alpha-1,3-rhamnosyl/mannosyltransferase
MNLAFDSRPASELSGVARYTRCLLHELRSCLTVDITETHKPRAHVADLYHAPWLAGAMLHPPLPMVVTVHDASSLHLSSELTRGGMRLRLRYLAVERALRVICTTTAAAEQTIDRLGLSVDQVVVIPEAADPVFSPRGTKAVAAARRRFSLPERYLLWVGDLTSAMHRRSITAIAHAHRQLPLVLVGPGDRWARSFSNVVTTGEVSDDDLAAIYTGAHALMFPGDGNGFGLTAIEALACGTPVVGYDTPATAEVLGERAELVPAGQVDALLEAAHAAVRPQVPVAPEWTWSAVAAATCEVYQAALDHCESLPAVRPSIRRGRDHDRQPSARV